MKQTIQTQLFRGFSSFENNKKILYDVDLIKADLTNHFYTRKGERVMFPNFGSIIWDMIFEPFNNHVIELIEDDVKSIVKLDSRLELESVYVDSIEHGITIEMTLLYKPWNVQDTFTVDFDRRTVSNANAGDI